MTNNANKKKTEVCKTLLEFTKHVYVETPLRDSLLAESRDMWSILVIASKLATSTWKETQRTLIEGAMSEVFVRESTNSNVTSNSPLLLFACLDLLRSFFKTTFTKDSMSKRIENDVKLIENAVEFLANINFEPSDRDQSKDTLGISNQEIVDRVKYLADDILGILQAEGAEVVEEIVEPVMPMIRRREKQEESADAVGTNFGEGTMKKMMTEDFPQYLKICMSGLKNSDRAIEAMSKKEQQYLSTLEAVEKMTDPKDLEYLQAASGISSYKGEHFEGIGASSAKSEEEEEEQTTFMKMKAGYLRYCQSIYTVLMGGSMLGVILTLTFVAAFATVFQMVTNKDVAILATSEYVISWFFIVELALR